MLHDREFGVDNTRCSWIATYSWLSPQNHIHFQCLFPMHYTICTYAVILRTMPERHALRGTRLQGRAATIQNPIIKNRYPRRDASLTRAPHSNAFAGKLSRMRLP